MILTPKSPTGLFPHNLPEIEGNTRFYVAIFALRRRPDTASRNNAPLYPVNKYDFYNYAFTGGAFRLGIVGTASAIWMLPEDKPLPGPGQWGPFFEWLPLRTWDENLG